MSNDIQNIWIDFKILMIMKSEILRFKKNEKYFSQENNVSVNFNYNDSFYEKLFNLRFIDI